MGSRQRPMRLHNSEFTGSLTRTRVSLDKQVKRSSNIRESFATLRGSAFAYYHDTAKQIARTLGVSVSLAELKEWFARGVSMRKVRSYLAQREKPKQRGEF